MHTNKQRAAAGMHACVAGDPDGGWETDPWTSAVDTVANILHAVQAHHPAIDHTEIANEVLRSARDHFVCEAAGLD